MKLRIVLWLLVFFAVGSIQAEAMTHAQPPSAVTDRAIVQVTTPNGHKNIESVPWSDLNKMQNIKVLQPDYIRSVADYVASKELVTWATDRVGFNHMKSQFTHQTKDITVAIVDTGVDYTHTFLADRIVPGYDFVDQDTDPMDEHFHGTHIAGILKEVTTDNVKIMPIRALDKDGNGYDTDIAKGIRYAVDHGASVINMSFEGAGYSTYLSSAISYAINHGVLIIAAAGNEGDDVANYYPASDERIIVVSATDRYDDIASFSNTGASIDIAAPGVDILSSIPGNQYGELDGTSMATPFISGLAAMLMLDKPGRTIEEVEQLLKTYVDDEGEVGWDPLYGYGIVNVSKFEKYSLINAAYKLNDFKEIFAKQNVDTHKSWTVKLNGPIDNSSIISVKIYSDKEEIGTSYTVKPLERKVIINANMTYSPNTSYVLEIVIKGGKKYLMRFTTGNN